MACNVHQSVFFQVSLWQKGWNMKDSTTTQPAWSHPERMFYFPNCKKCRTPGHNQLLLQSQNYQSCRTLYHQLSGCHNYWNTPLTTNTYTLFWSMPCLSILHKQNNIHLNKLSSNEIKYVHCKTPIQFYIITSIGHPNVPAWIGPISWQINPYSRES